jgi:antirestriction protein ArdC
VFRKTKGKDTLMPKHSTTARRDLYQDITDRIVAAIKAGTPPWRPPWDPDKCGGPVMPRNAVSGHRYRGINVITLGMSPLAFMTSDPRWATYKQAAERGWQVRGGERGTLGIFYKRLTVSENGDAGAGDDNKVRHIPMLRAFTLFRASQIDGIPSYVAPTVAEAPWRAPEAGRNHSRQQPRRSSHRRRARVLFARDRSHPDAAARRLCQCWRLGKHAVA